MKIAIVDDNEGYSAFLSAILSGKGYEVVRLTTLDAAKDYFSALVEGLCAVVLDYTVGVKTSDSLALTIKKYNPQATVLMASGVFPLESEKISELLKNGVISGLLRKPFSYQELMAFLQKEDCIAGGAQTKDAGSTSSSR